MNGCFLQICFCSLHIWRICALHILFILSLKHDSGMASVNIHFLSKRVPLRTFYFPPGEYVSFRLFAPCSAPSLNLYPSVVLQAQIQLDCGEDNICVPDLKLAVYGWEEITFLLLFQPSTAGQVMQNFAGQFSPSAAEIKTPHRNENCSHSTSLCFLSAGHEVVGFMWLVGAMGTSEGSTHARGCLFALDIASTWFCGVTRNPTPRNRGVGEPGSDSPHQKQLNPLSV